MKPKILKVQHEGKEIEVIAAQDGMPLYEVDGKDVPFDAPHAVNKVKTVSNERDEYEKTARRLETTLKAFEVDGALADPAKVREAFTTVANLDKGKLKDAEEIERFKREAQTALATQIESLKSTHAAEVAKLRGGYESAILGEKLATSKFLNERTTVIPEFARDAWGPHRLQRDDQGRVTGGTGFDFENGNPVAYDQGKKLIGKKPGEYADVDEALEHFIGSHPQKDRLLKGVGSTGSGNQPAAAGGGGSGAYSEDQIKNMPMSEYRKAREEGRIA